MRQIIILWRVLLGVGIIILGFFIFNYHLPYYGVKTIIYDFRAPDGTISHAYPVVRVRDMAFADGRSYRPMIEDPLYIDIKTLAQYRAVRIELVYQNTTDTPLQIGMKRAGNGTAFELKSFENEPREWEWRRGEVLFDLSGASYYNGKYTFAFSVPGLKTENSSAGEVRLSRMALTLKRSQLSWNDIKTLWGKF